MSDRAAFRGIFTIEASQTFKVQLYTDMIVSWTAEGFKLWKVFAHHFWCLTAFPLGKKHHKLDSAQLVCEKSPWPVVPVL